MPHEQYIWVFEEDELEFKRVRGMPPAHELLAQNGLFYLNDIANPLCLNTFLVVKKVMQIRASERAAYPAIGVGKLWGHWIVRMKVFSGYYRSHKSLRVRPVPLHCDGHDLLDQKGIFGLVDVCRVLPFTPRQLRYQAGKYSDAEARLGIWKDKDLEKYLVDMERFGPWVRKIWFQYSAYAR